jgi:Protein of unknown function (DUF1573)
MDASYSTNERGRRPSVCRRVVLTAAASWAAMVWGGPGARAQDAEGKPKLVVETTEIDNGLMEPGPKTEFTFHLKNNGTAMLEILSVKASCGCIATEYDKEVAPGSEGEVRVTVTTEGKHGSSISNVTVYTNDPDMSVVPLTVKAFLRRAIEPLPSSDVLFPIQRGQGQDRIVTIHSFEPEPMQIVKVESSAPYVKATLLPETDVPDDTGQKSRWRRQIKIEVTPDGPESAFAETVTVYTNSAKCPQVVLNVTGTPEGAVMAMPTHIYFGNIAAEPQTPLARSITLMSYGDPFKLLDTECSDPALKFQVIQDHAGRFCEVIVRYAGGWKPGFVKGKFILKTSDRMRPLIEVPFEAEVGP